MKKIILTLLLIVFMIPSVNAETGVLSYENFDFWIENKEDFENKAISLTEYYNNNLSNYYDYYILSFNTNLNDLVMYVTNDYGFDSTRTGDGQTFYYMEVARDIKTYQISENIVTEYISMSGYSIANNYFTYTKDNIFSNIKLYYDTNINSLYNLTLIKATYTNFNYNYNSLAITNIYNDSIIVKDGEPFPKIRNLLKYNSFSDYITNNNISEVNLNNYDYVILNLKDYSKKEAFETKFQVKGMIGITPVYNYGQAEKTDITDRCNASYTDFTDYRFFVLKNDIINNAVYYVKACEENSTFRFDNTIFDITYITADTENDPVISVGGVEYQTIPFNKLSTTANSNEDNNYIPGESGSSLTDIVDNASDFTSDIWNAISSFMSLVTKFFNTLPEEFRIISISGFSILITIAIIKFLRG